MRGLLNTDHLPSLILGTLALAVAANSYELLCTMGLPMVFTRILTLEQLPQLQYYGYLALYNLVYVIPLVVIVAVFVATMGRRKLSEAGGRFLKLLSGSMMGALGLALVFAPELLSRPLLAIALIAAAILFSLLVQALYRGRPVSKA
jgi:surface polysaccharide O-acyltransferase-like enzyme